MPHETPHIASPNASTDNDGAKKTMKTAQNIQPIQNMNVRRHPKRSWQKPLIIKPASWPTSAELLRPDCHSGGMSFSPVAGSVVPKVLRN